MNILNRNHIIYSIIDNHQLRSITFKKDMMKRIIAASIILLMPMIVYSIANKSWMTFLVMLFICFQILLSVHLFYRIFIKRNDLFIINHFIENWLMVLMYVGALFFHLFALVMVYSWILSVFFTMVIICCFYLTIKYQKIVYKEAVDAFYYYFDNRLAQFEWFDFFRSNAVIQIPEHIRSRIWYAFGAGLILLGFARFANMYEGGAASYVLFAVVGGVSYVMFLMFTEGRFRIIALVPAMLEAAQRLKDDREVLAVGDEGSINVKNTVNTP